MNCGSIRSVASARWVALGVSGQSRLVVSVQSTRSTKISVSILDAPTVEERSGVRCVQSSRQQSGYRLQFSGVSHQLGIGCCDQTTYPSVGGLPCGPLPGRFCWEVLHPHPFAYEGRSWGRRFPCRFQVCSICTVRGRMRGEHPKKLSAIMKPLRACR